MNTKQQVARQFGKWLAEYHQGWVSEHGKDRKIRLGLGSGTTVWACIHEIPKTGIVFDQIVAASQKTVDECRNQSLESVESFDDWQKKSLQGEQFDIYVDGADEINANGVMIKGGGGAALQEKTIASHAKEFICVAEERKLVAELGDFGIPLAIERETNARLVQELTNGFEELRHLIEKVTEDLTDQGHARYLLRSGSLKDPYRLEEILNTLRRVGIVAHGIFSRQSARLLITEQQVRELTQQMQASRRSLQTLVDKMWHLVQVRRKGLRQLELIVEKYAGKPQRTAAV